MRGWSAPKFLGRGLRPLATFAPPSLRSLHHPPESRCALSPFALRRTGSLLRRGLQEVAAGVVSVHNPVGNIFSLSSRPVAGASRCLGFEDFFSTKNNPLQARRPRFAGLDSRREFGRNQAGARRCPVSLRARERPSSPRQFLVDAGP
jgi:hypothetical protein